MFFRKKLERARKFQMEQNAAKRGDPGADIPTAEDLREENRPLPLEKGDLSALIISAMITFLPVALIILLILCAVMFLFI